MKIQPNSLRAAPFSGLHVRRTLSRVHNDTVECWRRPHTQPLVRAHLPHHLQASHSQYVPVRRPEPLGLLVYVHDRLVLAQRLTAWQRPPSLAPNRPPCMACTHAAAPLGKRKTMRVYLKCFQSHGSVAPRPHVSPPRVRTLQHERAERSQAHNRLGLRFPATYLTSSRVMSFQVSSSGVCDVPQAPPPILYRCAPRLWRIRQVCQVRHIAMLHAHQHLTIQHQYHNNHKH